MGQSLKTAPRAPDGNRTRTDISVHGIFLLLLLLHKPASSAMLSRCSLDYFITLHINVFRFSLYSLCAIYQPKLNLVSHHQSIHFYMRGFCFLGEFYLQSFPCSTLVIFASITIRQSMTTDKIDTKPKSPACLPIPPPERTGCKDSKKFNIDFN